MSRRRSKRPQQRTQPRPAATKALVGAGTPMAGQHADHATPLQQLLQQTQQRQYIDSLPLPRDTRDNDTFGPGSALTPSPLDPVRDDTGRAEPRGSEYDVSRNLRLGGDRHIPWQILRDAADGVGIIRRCIQVRKKHIRGLKGAWTVSADAIQEAYRADPRRGHDDIGAELREKFAPEISRLTAFWTNPWRGHTKGVGAWLNMLQEEVIVLDALAIYPQRDQNGDIHSFRILDGSTIKPLLNYLGHTPAAPYPAFQQLLYGFPRGEYLASIATDDDGADVLDADGNPMVEAPFASDELFYWRENQRTFSPYGLSDVEQALVDARLYLKRQGWMFAEYDDGSAPAAWLVPDGSGSELDLRQHRKWEDALNDEMSGNTRRRKRVKLAPPGMKPEMMPSEAERYKPDYDLHLIKMVASHLGVNIAELGFTEAKGLGSSGYHEGQEDVQARVGQRPDSEMIAEIIVCLSREFLDAPPELEYSLTGLESEDEAAADAVADARVKSGRLTLNEDRRRQGLPLFGFAEADMPMLMTQRGVVYLEGSSVVAPPGELVQPLQAPPDAEGADLSAAGDAEEGDGADEGDGRPAAAGRPAARTAAAAAGTDKAVATAKSAIPGPPPLHRIPDLTAEQIVEVTAYRRWLKKRAGDPDGKPFEFATLTAGQALAFGLIKPGETHRIATFKAADPKASARHWPGWDRDQEAAAHWAQQIRTALTEGVDTHDIAQSWLDQRTPAKAAAPGSDDADGWLTALGIAAGIAAVLWPVLRDAWTEGWFIGDRAAHAAAFSVDVDWAGWTPGDPQAARLILGPDGTGAGLAQLLDDGNIRINSIAAGRLDQLAVVLADALANGDSVDTLARQLRGVLDDPQWADLVAVTEINRATSAATLETYRASGIDGKSWMTAADDRVCPTICEPNGIDGPIPVGAAFTSGVDAPPGHPRCRCALAPEFLTPADAAYTAADLNTGETP